MLIQFAFEFPRTCRASSFGLLGFGKPFFLFKFGFERLILPIRIGKNLLADNFEEADEKSTRTAGRVADDVPFLRLHHANHKFDDGARREELPDLAPERSAKETLKRNALDVFAGVGKIIPLQAA